MTEVKLYEHPCYTEYKNKWEMYEDFYEGDHDDLVQTKYLIPHELESIPGKADSARIRKIREDRTEVENETEPVVSRFTSLFLKKEPAYDNKITGLFTEQGIKDVTGKGKSLTSFIREDIVESVIVYGKVVVLTDAYTITAGSKAEEQARGLTPTLEVLPVLDVKDWQYDDAPERKGKLKFLRYEYELIEPRQNATEEPVTGLYSKEYNFEVIPGAELGRLTVVTYKQSKKTGGESQWVQISAQEKLAPDMPIKMIEGESWIKDVVPLCKKLLNLISSRDNIHLYQAHQQKYIIGNINEGAKKAVAEYTIGFLPEGSSITVIEPVNTASIDANIANTRASIPRIAFNQNRTPSSDTKAVESVDTQQEGKEQLITLIKSEIESIENLINAVIKDYAYFKTSKTDFDGKLILSKEIKIEDLDREVRIYTALRDDVAKYPKWHKETLKKFVNSQELDNTVDIIEEIDKGPQLVNTLDARARLLGAING